MTDKKEKLESKARRLIKREYVAWLTTIGSDLAPQPRSPHSPFEQRAGQPRPIWFIWDKDSFLIFSQSQAHNLKHVKKHLTVSLHFNTDETGDKEYSVAIRVTPTSLRGW